MYIASSVTTQYPKVKKTYFSNEISMCNTEDIEPWILVSSIPIRPMDTNFPATN